jgi:hypothetical protein
LPDHSIAIADTYNGTIRRYDPIIDQVSTIAIDLDEPSGVVVFSDDMLVVESGAHRIVRTAIEPQQTTPTTMPPTRPITELAPGPVQLDVVFTVPPGRKLDESEGPATRLSVTSSPPGLLVAGGGELTTLQTTLTLTEGDGVLNITAQAASCDDDETEHPACYLSRQDWGVPVRITAGASTHLELMLLG